MPQRHAGGKNVVGGYLKRWWIFNDSKIKLKLPKRKVFIGIVSENSGVHLLAWMCLRIQITLWRMFLLSYPEFSFFFWLNCHTCFPHLGLLAASELRSASLSPPVRNFSYPMFPAIAPGLTLIDYNAHSYKDMFTSEPTTVCWPGLHAWVT